MSLKPNICVRSEVPATVSRQSATKASELRDSATTCILNGISHQFLFNNKKDTITTAEELDDNDDINNYELEMQLSLEV